MGLAGPLSSTPERQLSGHLSKERAVPKSSFESLIHLGDLDERLAHEKPSAMPSYKAICIIPTGFRLLYTSQLMEYTC